MSDEFPPELIERCREKVWPTEHVDDAIVAVLQESGHAELVAALKGLEPYIDSIVCYASTMDEYEPNRLIDNTRKALRKAGSL